MKKGYLPLEHHYRLIKDHTPEMRWDGKEDFNQWKSRAKEKLFDLLGIAEIEKFACPVEVEIEFDRYAEDLDAREIRFRFRSEENVTIPCHLCIPKSAEGKKTPVMITLQGHSTGMHVGLSRPKFPGDQQSLNMNWDRDYSKIALKEGLCVVVLEQRGFGENGGHPTSGNPRCTEVAKRAMLLGRTLIGERVWDVGRCIDALESTFADLVDLDKILLMGNSGGGTATTYTAIFEDRVKIAVPSCAVCDWEDSVAIMAHCACNHVPYIAKYFDMGDLVAMTAPKREVVVSGTVDNGFLIDGAINAVAVGRRGYEALGVSDKLVHVIAEGDHRFYAKESYPYIHKLIGEL
ncbi:MAG: hypothetical protein IJY39_14540 [Clostridia bacterium]|nr:hypothetical protein [Clostridia bacterium]